MGREIFFVGFTEDEAKSFIESIVNRCLEKFIYQAGNGEKKLTIRQACKYLGVSPPTLREFVRKGIFRRHDAGSRKKFFFLSELNEDLKALSRYK
jgi:excisionase family DNA binding protein